MSTAPLIDMSISEIERLELENERLQAQLAEARTIVFAIHMPDDCDVDHHGFCQVHTALKVNGRCGQLVAREWLAAR
ncbi:MAG: hypothetical protein H6658_19060 [Ardenticatenaceae bacterium]|nr:hypothetical protein [Ardenticatenaceae bacterium]